MRKAEEGEGGGYFLMLQKGCTGFKRLNISGYKIRYFFKRGSCGLKKYLK